MNINKLAVFLCVAIATQFSIAEDGNLQADSFHQIYSSVCQKALNNPEALKQQLTKAPQLPPEKAAKFLNGSSGSAWPIPDKTGLFILSLPDDKNMCSIYARRANAERVEEKFIQLVSNAHPPFKAKKIHDAYTTTLSNGEVRTIEYEWSVENSKRKLLFTLTTSKLATAEIQALGSMSLASE